MKITFVLIGLLFFGCANRPKPRCGRYHIREHWTLYVWVEDDPEIPAEYVMQGCRYWEVVGVACSLTRHRDDSHIQVYVDHEDCDAGVRGHVIGRAWPGGKIVLYNSCVSHDEESLVNISAHEIGHELGVGHTEQEYSSVMSPVIDRMNACLLEADIEAWNRRSLFNSVLETEIANNILLIPWCDLPYRE